MAFDEFLASIQDPMLRQVAEHWNEARGGKRAPIWHDIDPVAIGPCLSVVWAWRWDLELQQFIGRLSGELSSAVIKKAMRGRTLRDVFGDELGQETHDLYFRVMSEPALFHATGRIYGMFGGVGVGERIIMPLGEAAGEGVLGATSYYLTEQAEGDEIKGDFETKLRAFYSLASLSGMNGRGGSAQPGAQLEIARI